jgi:hypothetical protein
MRLIVIAKMDNSLSLPPSSSSATTQRSPSKLTHTQNKNKDTIDDVITINEKVNLTKHQHQVLKIICDTYQISFSEYMQQALVEAMRFDIEEGNFSDALLEKIGSEGTKKDSSSPSPSAASLASDLLKSDLDLLKKLQSQV